VVGLSGGLYVGAACVLGVAFLWLAFRFARRRDRASARILFFGSITYLPLLWVALVLDRVL
jgi:heme O synthase-like polyprenyltransferase